MFLISCPFRLSNALFDDDDVVVVVVSVSGYAVVVAMLTELGVFHNYVLFLSNCLYSICVFAKVNK